MDPQRKSRRQGSVTLAVGAMQITSMMLSHAAQRGNMEERAGPE